MASTPTKNAPASEFIGGVNINMVTQEFMSVLLKNMTRKQKIKAMRDWRRRANNLGFGALLKNINSKSTVVLGS